MLSASAWAEQAVYAQLSSLANQLGPNVKTVAMEKVDELHGLGHSSDQVVIKTSGAYFVMAAAQMGSGKSEQPNGYIDLWLVKNGDRISNSNTRQSIDTKHSTSVLISQAVIHLEKGDKISAGFFANKSSLGLISTPATNDEPAIPSIIFSIFKI